MYLRFKTSICCVAVVVLTILFSRSSEAEIAYRFFGVDHQFSDVGVQGKLPPSYFPIYSTLLKRALCGTLDSEFDVATAANYWADEQGKIHVSQTCDYVLNGDTRFVAVAFDSQGTPIAHSDAYRNLLNSGLIDPLTNAEIVASVADGPVYHSEATLSEWPDATSLPAAAAEQACAKGTFYPLFQIIRRETNMPMALAGCTVGTGEDEILLIAFDSRGGAIVTNKAAFKEVTSEAAQDLMARRAPGTFAGMTLVPLDAEDLATLGQPGFRSGLLVTEVGTSSAAWTRSFRPNIVIVEVRGKPVATVADLDAAKAEAMSDQKASLPALTIVAGETRFLTLPLN